jgi:type II secretory pathway pseudopilin PulG
MMCNIFSRCQCTTRSNASATPPGLTLVEIVVFLAVVATALTATMSIYTSQSLALRQSEDRRIASRVAQQKLDEIRIFLQAGNSLDQAFQFYGPLPLPTGGSGARFEVPGLTPFIDTDLADGNRPVPRAVGTVTIINDESPDERYFGYDYANHCMLPPFGVDIDGNGSRMIETGFGQNGAVGYNDNTPPPFPIDLNGNGSDGSAARPWDSNLISGFTMLPVVITIQWQGLDGPRRYDLFSIITPVHP